MVLEKLQIAVDFIRSQSNFKPQVGLTLGSGLGAFVDEMKVEAKIPFQEIPHFLPTTIEGHQGNLIFGTVGTKISQSSKAVFIITKDTAWNLLCSPLVL